VDALLTPSYLLLSTTPPIFVTQAIRRGDRQRHSMVLDRVPPPPELRAAAQHC
jgi:hypothetical protein